MPKWYKFRSRVNKKNNTWNKVTAPESRDYNFAYELQLDRTIESITSHSPQFSGHVPPLVAKLLSGKNGPQEVLAHAVKFIIQEEIENKLFSGESFKTRARGGTGDLLATKIVPGVTTLWGSKVFEELGHRAGAIEKYYDPRFPGFKDEMSRIRERYPQYVSKLDYNTNTAQLGLISALIALEELLDTPPQEQEGEGEAQSLSDLLNQLLQEAGMEESESGDGGEGQGSTDYEVDSDSLPSGKEQTPKEQEWLKDSKVLQRSLKNLDDFPRNFKFHMPKGSYSNKHHHAQIKLLTQYPMPIGQKLKAIIEDIKGIKGKTWNERGDVSRVTWKLNQGKTKVFTKPPPTRGKIVILMDMSGSMNCHHKHKENRYCSYQEGYVNSNAYMAVMVKSVIEASIPDTECFGFSSESLNYITPIPRFHAPCFHTAGTGNPDCVALLWVSKYLEGKNNPNLIVISDGQPAGAMGTKCSTPTHTKQVAHAMYESGTNFMHIDVSGTGGGSRHIYPADINIHVGKPSELHRVREVIKKLNRK